MNHSPLSMLSWLIVRAIYTGVLGAFVFLSIVSYGLFPLIIALVLLVVWAFERQADETNPSRPKW